MAQENTGYDCWILFIFICFSVYLLGVDVHHYLKHGFWVDHGSLLEALESFFDEPVFVDWIGIRKILSEMRHVPFIEVLILGFFLQWFLPWLWNSVSEDVEKQTTEDK